METDLYLRKSRSKVYATLIMEISITPFCFSGLKNTLNASKILSTHPIGGKKYQNVSLAVCVSGLIGYISKLFDTFPPPDGMYVHYVELRV